MKNLIVLALPSFIMYLLALNWEFFILFLIIIVFDVITGVISGMKNGKYSSAKMKQGLLKKVGEIIVIFVVIILQRFLQLNGWFFPGDLPIFEFIITAFSFKEISSILENWIKMGVKIPEFMLKWFKITQDNINKDNQKSENEGDLNE